MIELHQISLALAALGLAAAIVTAVYWWKASRVGIPQAMVSISDVPELYILSIHVAFNESSRLNSWAAVWTGAAAVLSSAAPIFGVL